MFVRVHQIGGMPTEKTEVCHLECVCLYLAVLFSFVWSNTSVAQAGLYPCVTEMTLNFPSSCLYNSYMRMASTPPGHLYGSEDRTQGFMCVIYIGALPAALQLQIYCQPLNAYLRLMVSLLFPLPWGLEIGVRQGKSLEFPSLTE